MHERISGGAGSGKTYGLVKRAREFSGAALMLSATSYGADRLARLTGLPSTTPAGLASDIIRLTAPITSMVSTEKKSRFTSEKEYKQRLSLGSPVSLCGEEMKSFGETDIANFLFSSKIDYIYEAPYKYDTREGERAQYRPDFYLPEYDIYIEYFAVDREGNVPEYFEDADDYLRSMDWKFDLHERMGTVLIPLCAYERTDGILIKKLTTYLKHHKVKIAKRRKSEIYPKKPEKPEYTVSSLDTALERATEYVRDGSYVCPYERIFVDDIEYMSSAARTLIGALAVDISYTETEGESVRCPEKHFMFSYTDRGMMREMMSVISKLSRGSVFIIGRGGRDADILLYERTLKPRYDRESDTLKVRYLKKSELDISYFTASAAVGRECDIAFVLTRGFEHEDDRTLFTLAATRARSAVYFVTQTGNEPNAAREIREAERVPEKVGFKCPKCGANLVVKKSRYGEFLGCKKCKHKIRL